MGTGGKRWELSHMTEYIGTHEHKLDDKGRLTVPAQFQGILTEGAVITTGNSGELVIFPASTWSKLTSGLNEDPLRNQLDPEFDKVKDRIYGGAEKLEHDDKHRIIITRFQREHAGIEPRASVIVQGSGDSVKIWAPEKLKHRLQSA